MPVDRSPEAVIFDLFFTLVHPGTYPGGCGRLGWLAEVLGVDRDALRVRWEAFEPVLESGGAVGDGDGRAPELSWVAAVAAEFGVILDAADWALIEADWDYTRRAALANPPPQTLHTLVRLRSRGVRVAVLSNTHALEIRAWPRSPLAAAVDAVAFSHQIGACKPDRRAYTHVLHALTVPAAHAVYVGDGSNDELAGARAAGFRTVILAEEAPGQLTPGQLPRLRAQADTSVASLAELPRLLLPGP